MTRVRFRASRLTRFKPLLWLTLCAVILAGVLVPAAAHFQSRGGVGFAVLAVLVCYVPSAGLLWLSAVCRESSMWGFVYVGAGLIGRMGLALVSCVVLVLAVDRAAGVSLAYNLLIAYPLLLLVETVLIVRQEPRELEPPPLIPGRRLIPGGR